MEANSSFSASTKQAWWDRIMIAKLQPFQKNGLQKNARPIYGQVPSPLKANIRDKSRGTVVAMVSKQKIKRHCWDTVCHRPKLRPVLLRLCSRTLAIRWGAFLKTIERPNTRKEKEEKNKNQTCNAVRAKASVRLWRHYVSDEGFLAAEIRWLYYSSTRRVGLVLGWQ